MLSLAHMFGIVILTIAAFVSSGIEVAVATDASQVVRRASALARSSVESFSDDSEESPRHRKSSKSKKKKRNSEDEDSDDDSDSDDDDEPPAKPAPKKRLPAKRSKAVESDDDERPVSRSHHPASKPLKKPSTSLRSKKSTAHSLKESSSSGGGGSFLAKSGVATKITSLGNDLQKVVSDCLDLVKKIGIDGEEPQPFENENRGLMKERMARVEESLSSVHKAVSSMEKDMFGSAGTWDSSGKAAKGLKKKVSALEQNMKGIKGRMTALRKSSNTVALQIDKLEQGVGPLAQKASSLLQGLDSPPPEQPPQANPDASFSDRLDALASYAETMEQTVASLEVELRGAETRSAPQSKTHGFSDKAKNVESLFKSLKTRLTSLEQEV